MLSQSPCAGNRLCDLDNSNSVESGRVVDDVGRMTINLGMPYDELTFMAPHQPLDYPSALAAIREKVSRGDRVVYGEGVWSVRRPRKRSSNLSGRSMSWWSVAELLDLAVAHGFMPAAVHEASTEEWDEFESGYSACYATWLAEHDPETPDAGAVRSMAAVSARRTSVDIGEFMGMAYLALLAV